MSDVQQWVNLNSVSWADSAESEIQQETISNTPKSAWGQVTNVEVFDIAKAQEEEKKKKKTAPVQKKSDEPYQRREHQGERTYEGQRYNNNNNERRERDNNYERPARAPREKQPVPDSPPFVAFVGNLPFDATEKDLHEFFGDLGVVSLRLLFDHDTGRPKGISYVEFKTRDGLVNALKSDGYEFKGRSLRVDVESRKRENTRPNKSGFSDFSRPRQFDRPEPARERPKLNINPPPQRAQPAPAPEAPEAPEAPKAREEDPFGGKVDVDKLAEQARKQEERQREIEKRKQEEEKKRIEQRNAKHSSPSPTTVEGSWRKPPGGDASKPTGFYGKSNNHRGGKTDNRPVGGGRSQGHGRNYESQGSGPRTGGGVGRGSDPNRKEQNEAKQTSKSQAPTNRFAALGLNDSNGGDEENDE